MTEPSKSLRERDLQDLRDLVGAMRGGERRATSRVLTELERASPILPQLLSELQPHLGQALVVGITGPPGAGKSTLVNAYTQILRAQGKSVGIIAVDPSSPISGGAILGDRIRMTATLNDDGVFMRSLASRGHLGGLSPAAVRVIDGFDAAGKDVILLETVGTGQSEIDVAQIADISVVVTAPGLGDGIQAMKAGLLEIADILVVNKSDRDGAEATAQQMIAALSIQTSRTERPPVALTTATTGVGVGELVELVDKRAAQTLTMSITERRRARARYLITRAAVDLIDGKIKQAATNNKMDDLCDDILVGKTTPADAANDLLEQ